MAKIDVNKIDGYEAMSTEEKLQALEAFDFEEVERYKKAVSKANSEVADLKRKHNALLSQEEQEKQAKDEQLAQLQAKIEQMERDKKISDYKMKFVEELGFDSELANTASNALIGQSVEDLFSTLKKFLEKHDKDVKNNLLKSTPLPPAGNGDTSVNLVDLHKMSLKERMDFANKNPEVYKSLYNK